MGIKLASININGLRSGGKVPKRRKFFNWIKKIGLDIVFVQETHSDEKCAKFWQSEWGGQVVFSHGDHRSRGVAIFFNPRMQHLTLVKTASSDSGRYVIAVVEIDGSVCTLICSYGPNVDNPDCFEDLVRECENLRSGDIIWGGDFNFCMDMSLDRFTTARRPYNNERCRQTVTEYMQANSLLDIWRVLNPGRREYTCLRSNPISKSRIDLFLISDNLLQNAVSPTASIRNGYLSDHQMITLDINIRSLEFGKSFWKFNNSLLLDDDFVAQAKTRIKEIISDNSSADSACLLVQTVLCVLRGWIIQFASHKKIERRGHLLELEKKINTVESQATGDHSEFLDTLKEERENLIHESTQKGIISCKARWRHAAERGTAYFHGLNKRNRSGAVIKSLKLTHTASGETSDSMPDMLEECRFFYDKLYARGPDVQPEDFLTNVNLQCLSNDQVAITEMPFTAEELRASLNSMNGSTSPGPDGYTVPFYKMFWEELGSLIFSAVSEFYDKSFIPREVRSSITVLIPKKNRDAKSVESFRPISLLNVMFKIITKALAIREAKTSHRLVDGDQTAFIKGRYIGENVRLALDLIHFAKENHTQGLFLFCDWEKAYDSVSWEYLRCVLSKFGFGPNFRRWVSMIYPSDETQVTSAQIQLNGHLSPPYMINRGLRQGCPLSCGLFLMCMEPLLEKIRCNPLINGLHFGDTEIKVSAYADDLLLIMDGKSASLREAVKCMNEFHQVSGLKLNDQKTRPMWIGSCPDGQNRICPELELGWKNGPAEYLGVLLSPNEINIAEINYARKIAALRSKLAPWGSKGLTAYGKVHILKSEALSQLTYLMSVLAQPSEEQIKEINKIMFKFVWGTTEKVKRRTLQNILRRGGLKMPDVALHSNSLKIAWVKKFIDGACSSKWKVVVKDTLTIAGDVTVFHCDRDA